MMRVVRASLYGAGSGSGSRGLLLVRVIVGRGCCSRPWTAMLVAASVANVSAVGVCSAVLYPVVLASFFCVESGGCGGLSSIHLSK